MYSIGEVAKITGVSRDRLRNYEKYGLLSPSVNEENNYRFYSEFEIDKILAIQLYRAIDLGMGEIEQIVKNPDLDILENILDSKKKQVLAQISKLEAILQYTNVLQCDIQKIKDCLNNYKITFMPDFEISGEISDYRAYSEYNVLGSQAGEIPIIKKLYREISFSENEILDSRMLITSKKAGKQTKQKCVYTVVEEKGDDILQTVFKSTMKWVKDNGYEVMGKAYIEMLFLHQESDYMHSYLGVYVPVK